MAQEFQVTMRGNAVTLTGPVPGAGDPAPDFTAVDTSLQPFRLGDLRGKTVLVASVPSLDTQVCDTETRRFNEEAASLGPDVRIVTISMDLPFAQKRWCGAAGVERVTTVSDYRDRAFGEGWGLRIRENGLLARAVFVLDPAGVIRHAQVVPEVTQQPDYDAALNAVRSL